MPSKKYTKCSIHEKELAAWLNKTVEDLDNIVLFFDKDPDDDWELWENEDYIFINKALKERRFSPRGALKIASYLDQNEHRTLFYKIKDFLTQHDRRLRRSLAKKIIHEELSSPGKIIFKGDRAMIHKQSLRRILETNGSRLNKSFDDLQRSEIPLELNIDYAEIESEFWFSSSGAFRISRDLSQNLTNSSRKKSCEAVSFSLEPVLKEIESAEDKKQVKIEKAKKDAKKRDKNKCQITNKKSTKSDKFNLAAHHLYSVSEYPHLATNLENIVSLRDEIHQEFHAWMGGNKNPCTIDDFIEFLHTFYPENDSISFELHRRKHVISV